MANKDYHFNHFLTVADEHYRPTPPRQTVIIPVQQYLQVADPVPGAAADGVGRRALRPHLSPFDLETSPTPADWRQQ